MRSFTAIILAGIASLAAAAENPFIVPTTGFAPVAGESITITWNPTAGDTVTLVLRSGASSNLEEGSAIVEHTSNTGSYTWDVPSDTVRGSDYTIEIINDDDTSETNYYPYFVLESTVTVATTTSSYTYGAPTSTPAALSSAAAVSAAAVASSEASASASASASGTTLSTTKSASASASKTASNSASATATSSGSTAKSTSGSSTTTATETAPTSGAAAKVVSAGCALLGAAAVALAL